MLVETLKPKVKYVIYAGQVLVSGTLIDFPEELEIVTPIRFDTWRKEQEIDGAAISTSYSAEPVLISKQAATVAMRSLHEAEGESVRDRIFWPNIFVINTLWYGSADRELAQSDRFLLIHTESRKSGTATAGAKGRNIVIVNGDIGAGHWDGGVVMRNKITTVSAM